MSEFDLRGIAWLWHNSQTESTLKWRCDHRSCNCNSSYFELSPRKSFLSFNGIQTRCLCIHAAVLYQLCHEDPYVGSRPIYGVHLKEARNSFFGLGVYLLKSKFHIEDNLWFPWYYTTFSTYDHSLFSHWFRSNSCHHSNGNGQLLILNNVEYLDN